MSAPDAPRMTFAANDEYFVSGSSRGVQVWRRVEDSLPIATMATDDVRCVACSKDGKWIAAGSFWGDVMVWDAKIHKETFTTWKIEDVVRGLDFSPDGTRLIALGDRTATIWDLVTRGRVVRPLLRDSRVWAVRYSPRGDYIASATEQSVRIYNSNDVNGRPQEIPMQITTCQYNTSLAWSNDHLFVLSCGVIKKIHISTLAVSEWPVPDTDRFSRIVMSSKSKGGEFIACSANRTVTFWDTSTRARIGSLCHSRDISSISLSESSDNQFLAIGSKDEKITIKRLSRVTELPFEVDNSTLDLWNHGRFAEAEVSLTAAASTSLGSRHNILAARALLRTRLRRSDDAVADAKESIQLQSSAIGYIAKGVALLGQGKKRKAYRACDTAFQYSHPIHTSFLLLIKAVIVCMAGDHVDAICRIKNLIPTLHFDIECYVVQAYMYFLRGRSRMKSSDFDGALRSFVRARTRLRNHTSHTLSMISMISGWKFDGLDIVIRQNHCEALYAAGRFKRAGEHLYKIIRDCNHMSGSIAMWISGFLQRYLSNPQIGVPTVSPVHPADVSTPPETLELQFPIDLLEEWAKLRLSTGSWRDALLLAAEFKATKFVVYQTVCEVLDTLHKTVDASDCFHEMMRELGGDAGLPSEQADWVLGFKQDLFQKLEGMGDVAMQSRRCDEAIANYSAALSLHPASQSLLIKRSKAYVVEALAVKKQVREQARGECISGPVSPSYLPLLLRSLCEQSLNDANKAMELDPSSPWGHESRHAALHAAERYDDAIAAFQTMLLEISQSSDPKVRERKQQYIDPDQTKDAIRKTIQATLNDSPRVLIHTTSGRLLDRPKRSSLFESLPVYKELVSSMTTHIDQNHIQREVSHYYRYATFSHTWEQDEPLYDKVTNIVVYDLESSPTHDKLQMFCKIAKDGGLHWAWSDTCCINKGDQIVLQEALVAMFKWYEGSSVTIVFLRGVRSPSQPGDLMNSPWNTRGWTFQEYHASKVVRFYTENWRPYMDLDASNHKDCPEIITEMNGATSIAAESFRLSDLRPGLLHIREKLCLASQRETTFPEDAAYSLFGIFNISLPVMYGEGDQALGRLLAQLFTNSGDTSILAWTGKSGNFNSCLPNSIQVFCQVPSPLIPKLPSTSAVQTIPNRLRIRDSALATLYDRIHGLHIPSFQGQRMRLPCLTFRIKQLSLVTRGASGYVFSARTDALGTVEITTSENISRYDTLILVHPWIDFLLDRHPVTNTVSAHTSQVSILDSLNQAPYDAPIPGQATRQRRESHLFLHIGRTFTARTGDTSSLLSLSSPSLAEKRSHALNLLVRLQQRFGALLFTPTHENGELYKRVSPQSLIMVQVGELSSAVLNKLIDGVRMLDVL